jgi:beta-lactamase class A
VLTLKQIIEYIVYYSDNTAFKMLYNTAGSSGGVLALGDFDNIARKDYKAPFYDGTYGTVLNAGGVGRMFCEIYKRSESSELFAWYVDLLKDANENVFIKKGLPKDEESGECLYEVAHKYGMDIKASNDAAIVFYGDRPYVLVVLTDYLGDSNAGFIIDVSKDVFAIHEYICDETKWK